MVSVIIPTYNRANTITESVKSVLAQTYHDIEVIVVDDNSSDNTFEVLKRINDPRLIYIKQDINQGACAARNRGIENAKGEYIAFHDSDDVCRAERIEHELAALKKNKSDVVFCDLNRNYANNDAFPNIEEGYKSFKDILFGFYISTQTILGKAEVFQEFKFDINVKRMQDYDLMIRVAQKYKVYYINEVLVDVYMQSDSLTVNQNNYAKEELVLKNILIKYPELAEKYPKWKAIILERLLKPLVMQDKSAEEEIRFINSVIPNKKNRIKWFLYKTHLLKFAYKHYL